MQVVRSGACVVWVDGWSLVVGLGEFTKSDTTWQLPESSSLGHVTTEGHSEYKYNSTNFFLHPWPTGDSQSTAVYGQITYRAYHEQLKHSSETPPPHLELQP
jgi:hypothetical protein